MPSSSARAETGLSPEFRMTSLLARRLGIPFPKDAPGFIRKLAGLMAEGRFRGIFDRSYPIGEIIEAFQYVETGQKTGIVVIDVR